MGADALLLIQFARSPQVGRVKTRMMPALTATEACELHCELTRWTCRQLLASGLGDVELAVAGNRRHALFDECTAMGVRRLVRQIGDDLGQRMNHAVRCGLARYSRVILVGSDCPGIDPDYLQQAVTALDATPVVLGPAADGGYVLLGARAITDGMFGGIPWGSAQVLARTRAALQRAGVAWTELPTLTDIDRPDDLSVWESLKR